MTPSSLLIFDGDCGYCRKWINRWKKWNSQTQYISYQEYSRSHSDPPLQELKKAVYFIEEGRTYRAAHAVFRLLRPHPIGRILLWGYESIPPFRWIAESVYAFVARIRRRLGGRGSQCDIESP